MHIGPAKSNQTNQRVQDWEGVGGGAGGAPGFWSTLDLEGDGLPREVLTKNCIFLLLVRAGGSQDGRVRTTEQVRKQTKMTGGCLRLGSGSRTSIEVAAHQGDNVSKATGLWVGAEDLRRP